MPDINDRRALILRSCAADLTSRHGSFQWPESGPVEAPDWNPAPVCGGGLHGLLWGEGNGALMDYGEGVRYVVAEVDAADVVAIDGGEKVKVPRANVVFVGDLPDAAAYIAANGGAGRAICGHTATAGYHGTATAGNRGTATAGDLGTATAGNRGTATAGDFGTATAGYHGTATAGYHGTATAGYHGTATAGEGGTATAGDYGTATAGEGGTATAGYHGTATAGDCGTATAGDCGTATAGEGGVLSILYWDDARDLYRRLIGEVGELGSIGLRPGVAYRAEVVEGVARFVPVADNEEAASD